MLRAGIAFLAGIVCALQAPSLLHLTWWSALAWLALALAPPGAVRACSLALAAGLSWVLGNAALQTSERLPAALEGRDLILEGRVIGVPEATARFTRFEFAPHGHIDGVRPPARVRLSWYRDAPRLRSGELWRLQVRLKRVHGLRNPGAFDYEAWAFARGIGALGYVREHRGNTRLGQSGAGWLDRWRETLAARIAAGGYASAPLLAALVTGLRHAMTPSHWEVLRRTGTSHLFAISGLHVGLAAAFGHLLAAGLWRLLPRPVLLRCPRQRVAAAGALLAALVYAALSGFSLPTQRALLTLGVLLGGVLCARGLRPGTSLGLALTGVLLLDPWAPLSAGFWLSFAAVAGIAWVLAGRSRMRRRRFAALGGFVRVQVCLALLLAPLLLVFFQRSAPLGGVANLLAVPLVSLVTVPSALLGAAAAAAGASVNPALWLADQTLTGLWRVLEVVAAWPGAEWRRAMPSPLALVCATVAALLACAPRLPVPRVLSLVLLLPLLAPRPPHPAPGTFRLHVLDVGQGLAAVVETHRHVVVYDTGARYSARFDLGRAAVLPVLRLLGWRHVDLLVVSHPDNDHSGGAGSLLEEMSVRQVLASRPALLPPRARAAPCRRGQRWQWDGVQFAFLHPPARWRGNRNDRSCVLRVSTGTRAVLLSGDIEARAEQSLLGAGIDLRADVLTVPHHGSSTSSTPAFLAQVAPRYAVVSAGFRNRYGFPDVAVRARLARAGACVIETASSGALSFEITPGGVRSPRRHRLQTRRFWHALPAPGTKIEYHPAGFLRPDQIARHSVSHSSAARSPVWPVCCESR